MAAGTTEPSAGEELTNEKLSTALLSQGDFTQEEWDAFGIKSLLKIHFIKAGESYFEPAVELPSCEAMLIYLTGRTWTSEDGASTTLCTVAAHCPSMLKRRTVHADLGPCHAVTVAARIILRGRVV